MMEIIRRKKTSTLWKSKDAEGRNVYAETEDIDGISVEPRIIIHHTIISALKAYNQNKVL